MSRLGLGRLSLILVSLFGLMALFSASAIAAGKPTQVSANIKNPGSWGINHVEGAAYANPNGASTTVTLEYREHGTSTFKSAGSENIGSGTTQINFQRLISGLKPLAEYDLRTTATNSFGTTTSSIGVVETPRWIVHGMTKEDHVASFASTGTATFDLQMGSVKAHIACNETGSGTFGGYGGTGTGYKANLSNCTLYENEEEMCKPKVAPSLSLDQTFTSTSNLINFQFPSGCFYEEFTLAASEPFFVTMPNFNKTNVVAEPLTLTNKLKFGGNTVTATISTTWSLTGEDAGKLFGAWRVS